jgi:hypothetical protein
MESNKKVIAFLNGILQKEGTLCCRLSNANPNLNPTHTLVNNILCKFFRKYDENASDGRWADTHSHKQLLFKVVQDRAWIYDVKDTQPQFIESAWIQFVGFRDESISLYDVSRALRIPEDKILSDLAILAVKIRDALHYPAVTFQVPFDMDFLPELNNGTCKALLAELIARHVRTIILRKRQRN